AHGPVGIDELVSQFTEFSPPGTATLLSDVIAQFGELALPDPPQFTTRGRVRLQLSSPTISVTSGSSSEVSVHISVRAHYYPDANTDPLPEPLHGEIQAALELLQVGPDTDRRLVIRPSADENKIRFVPAPGTGLTAADVARISSTAIRQSVID